MRRENDSEMKRRLQSNRACLPWLAAACAAGVAAAAWAASETGRDRAAVMAGRLPPPRPAATNAAVDTGYVNFSFDQVDVASFVRLVGEITGRKFVIGDGVAGKITVVSPRVRSEEVYPLFVSILDSVGCSVIRDGPLYRVVALPARPSLMGQVIGAGDATPADGVVTKVLRVEHVSAGDLAKLLEPKVTGGRTGGIAAIDDTNHLVITDTGAIIRQIEKIVAEIDRPGLARITEIVQLTHASAGELSEQLNAAVQQRESRAQRMASRLPRAASAAASTAEDRRVAVVVPVPHSNSLMLVGTARQIEDLKTIIAKLDIDMPSGRGRLNAIFLKYLSAKDAAENINALLAKREGKAAPGAERGQAIAIQASEESNALLVDASPGDFEVVQNLVEQLDRVPSQVHISVMIAEVIVNDAFKYGVELAAVDMPEGRGDTVIQGSSTFADSASTIMNSIQSGIFPGGITVGLAYGSRIDDSGNVVVSYPGVLNVEAVKRDGRFRVISETSLEAQNNREASVNIVNEIPILSSTIEGGSGTARDVIQNIERIEVGTKLTLTPHVIPGGDVRMDLSPSIEVLMDGGSDNLTPTIARRSVKTTVTVPDGQTIIIAGLTREDESEVEERVPILGSIPLIGMLFRQKVKSHERTNLLIFVTPVVMDSDEKVNGMRREWELKTGLPEGRID